MFLVRIGSPLPFKVAKRPDSPASDAIAMIGAWNGAIGSTLEPVP